MPCAIRAERDPDRQREGRLASDTSFQGTEPEGWRPTNSATSSGPDRRMRCQSVRWVFTKVRPEIRGRQTANELRNQVNTRSHVKWGLGGSGLGAEDLGLEAGLGRLGAEGRD